MCAWLYSGVNFRFVSMKSREPIDCKLLIARGVKQIIHVCLSWLHWRFDIKVSQWLIPHFEMEQLFNILIDEPTDVKMRNISLRYAFPDYISGLDMVDISIPRDNIMKLSQAGLILVLC